MMRLKVNEQAPRLLALIVAVYVGLALVYNWASPLYENSDEFFHFPLVVHLAENGLVLPDQNPANNPDWAQQGNQPPAYHLLSAILIQPFDTGDYASTRYLNPHARLGVVSDSNINAVIHPLDRSQEWQPGAALALRFVRLFSTLLAAGLVVCAYYLTVYTFPALPKWVGLLAAALVAFNPMLLFVGSSVNNDNLSNLMISAVLALLVWLYRRADRPPTSSLLLIGVLLGVSLLSKLSTGPFMLLVGLFWLFLAIKHDAWRYMVVRGFMTLGVAGLISGWWYLRNFQLYGDPTGLSQFLKFAGERAVALTPEQLWSEREGFVQSFWGLFGSLTVPMADWVYTGFNLLAALSLVGVVIYWIDRLRGNHTPEPVPDANRWQRLVAYVDLPQVILVVWIALSGVSVIRWTAITWASQGRLWFIALTSLAALSAVGFYMLARLVRVPALAGVPAAYALVIAVAAPFLTIVPAYAAPDLLPRAEFDDAVTVFSDPAALDERLALVAADFPERIRAGDAPAVALVFCTETALSRDWSAFVHLVSPAGIILAQADFIPGGGALPTSQLAAGYCWRDSYRISVPAGIASADTPLDVMVGLYDATGGTGQRMVQELSGGNTHYVGETLLEAGDELARFRLGDAVRVTGYDLSQTVAAPGDALTITIAWEAVGTLDRDYTAFVQVLDPVTTYRAAASDKGPQPPASAWEPGDTIRDEHTLVFDEAAPPGVYTVIVGLYHQPEPGVFQRLRVSYDGVDTGFDALTLTRVRVE